MYNEVSGKYKADVITATKKDVLFSNMKSE
jgi:hypothetical protein